MRNQLLFSCALFFCILNMNAQVWNNPAITSWIFADGTIGTYYSAGNYTPVSNGIEANVQLVQYSTTHAYVSATGIPAFTIGPYLDGNPNNAGNQDYDGFKIPLNPVVESGTKEALGLGPQGVFINGTVIFNYADGRSYNNANVWFQSAVHFENAGFDCAKGHPAGTAYHHHQNPTAFNLDTVIVEDVCTLYDSDGLYVMDPSLHSPLIGFAKDGFPIYGAYAYANTDGTGGITRMVSGYDYVTNGVGTRTNGPNYAAEANGAYAEDFEFTGNGDLDVHNGRFAITPEYPAGTYAYYATVDSNENSFYPYLIGPTFYGEVENFPPGPTGYGHSTIPAGVTDFDPTVLAVSDYIINSNAIKMYPNPTSDLVTLQINDILHPDLKVQLMSITGKLVYEKTLESGSTICYFDTATLYNGVYVIVVSNGKSKQSFKVVIDKKF